MSGIKGLSHTLRLKNGDNIKVDCLGSGIFRIRRSPGDCLHESGLNRYGVIRIKPDLPTGSVKISKEAGGWTLTASGTTLHINADNGRVCLQGKNKSVILEEDEYKTKSDGRGFTAAFRLQEGDKLYGLGHVDCNTGSGNEAIQRRGKIYDMVQTSQISYAPIPFMMSPRGWAIFMNTTWFHTIDAGATDPDVLRFQVDGGDLDYYLIAGEYPKVLLDRYTRITGKPTLLPEWGYGLSFNVSAYEKQSDSNQLLEDARNFRDRDIPCDIMHITDWSDNEHGGFYNFTVDKDWSRDRYRIMDWCRKSAHKTESDYRFKLNDDHTLDHHCSFVGALEHMGFKLGLWLCCDYDLTEYEEQQLPEAALAVLNENKGKAEERRQAGISMVDKRLRNPVYLDKYTKPGEPWFEHLKKFIDDGARVFMQDGAKIGLQHPDRKWKNGMADNELHNLNCVIYVKQMYQGFAEYTNKRPMVYIARGYAGTQQYAAMWAGDNGGGASAMNALINHGFCGLSNGSTDMISFDEQGMHFGFFQTWSHVNGGITQPWYHGKHREGLFRYYSKLRHRLLPYIYSMAHVANKTGFPVMRGMPMVFQNDPKSDDLLYQYMFGDAFLVSAFTEEIHLPAGEWTNYWTGERAEGPVALPATYPEDRGGPLFVRAGAIIPMGPDQDYWGQKPMDILTVDVFPGSREEPFTLYEDDGDTEAYKEGKIATTVFNQRLENGKLTLNVSPRQGSYDGMPVQRKCQFEVHCQRPNAVRVGGKPVSDWRYDAGKSVLVIDPLAMPKNKTIDICISLGQKM